MDLTKYVETSIRESDFVLLICTPPFALKANTSQGGVGYEKGIVTGEIFQGVASPSKIRSLASKWDGCRILAFISQIQSLC